MWGDALLSAGGNRAHTSRSPHPFLWQSDQGGAAISEQPACHCGCPHSVPRAPCPGFGSPSPCQMPAHAECGPYGCGGVGQSVSQSQQVPCPACCSLFPSESPRKEGGGRSEAGHLEKTWNFHGGLEMPAEQSPCTRWPWRVRRQGFQQSRWRRMAPRAHGRMSPASQPHGPLRPQPLSESHGLNTCDWANPRGPLVLWAPPTLSLAWTILTASPSARLLSTPARGLSHSPHPASQDVRRCSGQCHFFPSLQSLMLSSVL